MCRNIRPLFNYDPPSTEQDIYASALQYVRKISGFGKPSKLNEAAFSQAVHEVSRATKQLMDTLVTTSTPRNREVEIARAKAKARERFGRAPSS
jgi:hypothetical protein